MKKQSFLYGAVIKLTRDDTLSDIERNFEQMKESGLDTVVVWPSAFWWEDKKEGYPFNTGKALLEIAERMGLRVIMELAGQLPMMEYIPDFKMKDEYFCVDENGHKRVKYASFGFLNYFHPEVNSLICEHFENTARAYRDYPALIAYDIFNETAFNSFDEYTMDVFRAWLKEKYGTIERLNEVWEHCYTDFSQVEYTPWTWMSVMPAADFNAFRKASIGIFLKNWCDAVRRADCSRPLIADNIGSMIVNGMGFYDRPQDDFALKDAVDEIGMSFYPKQVTGCQEPYKRWLAFDSYYAASNREGFYISEMQTHIQALFNPTTAVRPYELKQWCCEALSGGAKGLIYWMWRPFDKGLQTAGRGLVDYKNRSTPRLEFAREFASLIKEAGTLTPVRSKVGILFDGTCQDLQICYTKCYQVDQNIYLNSICGAYCAMHDAGIAADIVRLQDIKDYGLLILSNHIVIDKNTARALGEYVRDGGIIVCDGKVGIVDDDAKLNCELPGGAFNEFMGLEYIDSDYVDTSFTLDGVVYQGHYGKELTSLTDSHAIAAFSDGSPAVVEKKTGKGLVITVNTYLWYGYEKGNSSAKEFAELLANRFDLYGVRVDGPLKVRVAENGKYRFTFVFNYTNDKVSGNIKGQAFERKITLDAQEVIVLKEEI